jgi:hypothetical protein
MEPLPRTGPSSLWRIAVDDEHEVVEPLARREREPRERLGLVHLAVADERPHLAGARVGESAVLQVAHEARLVDRRERPESHRSRREMPEIRHEPRMGSTTRAPAARLTAIVIEVRFGKPSFEIGARVDAGRRMRLEVDEVARRPRAEEMIEADLEEIRGRSIAAMCPPSSPDSRFARTTIASAFQRTSAEMRDSISRLPGYGGCSASGIVLT